MNRPDSHAAIPRPAEDRWRAYGFRTGSRRAGRRVSRATGITRAAVRRCLYTLRELRYVSNEG
ncbi:MAG: helix-turn-helix domain-containing protein [Acetobacteraceae bacterium]